jgi:hypothetical protein
MTASTTIPRMIVQQRKGGTAMTRDRDFRQLGIDDAHAGRPRYRFAEARLQQLYDWGYDFEADVRRAEIAGRFRDPRDDDDGGA